MAESQHPKPAGVLRVIYREIVDGDLRKFAAESNDAETGGGARDLRFRPFNEFVQVFRKVFPEVRVVHRRRHGRQTEVEVLVGQLHWTDESGEHVSKEVSFEPPTDARPGEGRIPVVHTYAPLNKAPSFGEGRVVLLLIQRVDGTVWPAFATEQSLRSGGWDDTVSSAILRALAAKGPVVTGYIDLETGHEYGAND